MRSVIKVTNLKDSTYNESKFIIMCTEKGIIKRTKLKAYANPRKEGINAINIIEGDKLLSVKLTEGDGEIIMAVRSGIAIRFRESDVRAVGRNSIGVKGMTLKKDDKVIGMVYVTDMDTALLVISENGYGKRTPVDMYRLIKRGGKGVKTMHITKRTGKLIAIEAVKNINELMIVTQKGIAIRTNLDKIRLKGRSTQGVRLIKINEGDSIASVTIINPIEEEDQTLL